MSMVQLNQATLKGTWFFDTNLIGANLDQPTLSDSFLLKAILPDGTIVNNAETVFKQ